MPRWERFPGVRLCWEEGEEENGMSVEPGDAKLEGKGWRQGSRQMQGSDGGAADEVDH